MPITEDFLFLINYRFDIIIMDGFNVRVKLFVR